METRIQRAPLSAAEILHPQNLPFSCNHVTHPGNGRRGGCGVQWSKRRCCNKVAPKKCNWKKWNLHSLDVALNTPARVHLTPFPPTLALSDPAHSEPSDAQVQVSKSICSKLRAMCAALPMGSHGLYRVRGLKLPARCPAHSLLKGTCLMG